MGKEEDDILVYFSNASKYPRVFGWSAMSTISPGDTNFHATAASLVSWAGLKVPVTETL
jgi:hypothetical protein